MKIDKDRNYLKHPRKASHWAKLTGFRRLLLLSVVLTALLWGVLYAKPAVEEYEDTFVEGMALVY
ncbi:MAG: hypothetical protein GY754_03410, partial [bacterium]|nr:hypothetical protein [bacterium]